MKAVLFKQFFRTALAIIFLAGSLFYGLINVRAQATEPEFMFTWKARSYAPAEFSGKILPTDKSSITVSFEMIDRGRIVNLSKNDIYWYVNDDFFKGGAGLQEITFRASGVGRQVARITVNDYLGQTLIKSVEILSVKPEVVIPVPFPGGKLRDSRVWFEALPYFFNTKNPDNLGFEWKINDQSPEASGDPKVLNVTFRQIPVQGTTISISLNVKNPRNIFEMASKNITLRF
ncbi:MAG: hypothetical protein AAB738_00730 [Patescibacteria group bacterium]